MLRWLTDQRLGAKVRKVPKSSLLAKVCPSGARRSEPRRRQPFRRGNVVVDRDTHAAVAVIVTHPYLVDPIRGDARDPSQPSCSPSCLVSNTSLLPYRGMFGYNPHPGINAPPVVQNVVATGSSVAKHGVARLGATRQLMTSILNTNNVVGIAPLSLQIGSGKVLGNSSNSGPPVAHISAHLRQTRSRNQCPGPP